MHNPSCAAIILVNWNGYQDTIECLESLLRQDQALAQIIVVDNGSTDGSIVAIAAWAAARPVGPMQGPLWDDLPTQRCREPVLSLRKSGDLRPFADRPSAQTAPITLIEAGQNLGYAGGNNLGLALALANPEVGHIWFLNNDTVVAPDCLDRLLQAVQTDPSIGLLGARLMYYHDPKIVQALGGWFNPWICRGGHIGHNFNIETLPTQKAIDARLNYVVGASIFAPVDTIRQIGPMYEGYFLYFEELDWAARLPKFRRLATSLAAVVYHKEGASIGTNGFGRSSNTSLYYLTVNQLRYVARHRTWALPIAMARTVREVWKFAIRRDPEALYVIKLAVSDFLTAKYRKGPIATHR